MDSDPRVRESELRDDELTVRGLTYWAEAADHSNERRTSPRGMEEFAQRTFELIRNLERRIEALEAKDAKDKEAQQSQRQENSTSTLSDQETEQSQNGKEGT